MTLPEQPRRDKPLSFHWRSLDPAWTEFLNLPPVSSKGHERARNAIILDAALEAVGRGRWISYSRNRSFYTGQRRYHGAAYTYPTVVDNVDLLTNAGLLEHEKASGGGPTGWQSRFRASPRLLKTPPPLVLCDPGELVRLKHGDDLVDYRDTERTRRWRRHVEQMNEAIGAAVLDIDAPGQVRDGNVIRFGNHVVYPARLFLYRVFNGRWDRGGRFYGPWWQSVKSRDRPCITINGEATSELDYEQLHPRLLYRLAGERLEGGAYILDGWPRAFCKIAFNVLLNADNWHAARGAIVKETGLSPERAAQLIDAIKRRHRPIARFFYSGVGLRLQNIDAAMAEGVMLNLLKRGVVTLPVHDSYLAQRRHRGRLEEAMNDAFERAA